MPLFSSSEPVEIKQYDVPQGPLDQEISQDSFVLSSPLGWGETKLIQNGRLIHDGAVRPGMLRLMVPGDRAIVTTSVMKGAYAVFPGALFRKLAAPQGQDELRDLLHIDPLLYPDRRVYNIFTMLLSADEFGSRHYNLMVSGLAQSLLAILLEHHYRPTRVRPSRSKALSEVEFKRSVEYATSVLSTGLDREKWAHVLGMSSAEFSQRFQVRTGQAPYAWFMNLRIEKAKQLLLDHRIPLVDLAYSLGFSSQSHFHEAFRRRVGVTPGTWRFQNARKIR